VRTFAPPSDPMALFARQIAMALAPGALKLATSDELSRFLRNATLEIAVNVHVLHNVPPSSASLHWRTWRRCGTGEGEVWRHPSRGAAGNPVQTGAAWRVVHDSALSRCPIVLPVHARVSGTSTPSCQPCWLAGLPLLRA
jgi:hypothetical protein